MLTGRHATAGERDVRSTLAAAARRDAWGAEQRRRLGPEVAAALADAGFPRHFVPTRWRGTAGSFAGLLADASAAAENCAATGWCAALYAAHGRLAAYLPEQGQRDLWAQGPDVLIAASVVPPQGRAEAVSGGWRLDGQWRLASGVDHADWVLLASWTPGPGGPEHRIFAVPRAALSVQDTWFSVGLRGSGSNSVTAEGVVVPSHRSFPLSALLSALPGAARCHRVPYPMVAALIFAAPVLGAARAALRAWTAECVQAVPRRAEHVTLLARASAQIHAAGLLLACAAERADRGEITALTVAENRRDAATAALLCREAVDELFHASGMRGQNPDSPVQRAWRDVTTAAGHGALAVGSAADAYADAVLSREEHARDGGGAG
ncbi:oxidoreductase [Streptomyces sp. NBC_01335]|uniref:oxidoreductase n=1 Tax=Streptomyces sp. NBC_01335 TaxID=2903828 RepID=UPI002E1577E2|nr:oxidoreductase [Streptomyces sp. NBC_01335]